MQLADRLREVFSIDPSAWAIEFAGTQYTWGELRTLVDVIGRALNDTGTKEHDVIGWAARNSPSAVASLASIVSYEHCAAILNPHMAPQVLGDEIRRQRFAAIVGDPEFWEITGVAEAAKAAGSAGLVVTWTDSITSAQPYPGLERVGPGPHREPMPDILIELLTSGTTGPPKRSPQSREAMLIGLALGERSEGGVKQGPPTLKRSPSIIFRALAHAGSFAVLLALYSARPISLHDKFTVEAAVEALRRHRPKVASFVPTMIKMLWDAQVPTETFSGVIAIRSGTAPLDADLQARFEAKYGVPILVDYGATEFGGVTAWTLADHRQYAAAKRGSVGRAVAGVQMRVVDSETGAEITDGRLGILQVRIERKTQGWISTNDLVTIDAEGFLYIHGRADDAIVRGGFKILPEEIAKVLRQHPDVLDVAVVGVPDERLGQTPVAVIELRPGHAAPDEADLKAFARNYLPPYQVPVAFKFTDKLPRSASTKVIRSEVLKLARA